MQTDKPTTYIISDPLNNLVSNIELLIALLFLKFLIKSIRKQNEQSNPGIIISPSPIIQKPFYWIRGKISLQGKSTGIFYATAVIAFVPKTPTIS